MPIRLTGGLETDRTWSEFRELGNTKMAEHGLDHWTLEFRPLTASEREREGAELVDWLVARVGDEEISIAVAIGAVEPGLGSVRRLSEHFDDFLFELIDVVTGGDENDVDEGGEA